MAKKKGRKGRKKVGGQKKKETSSSNFRQKRLKKDTRQTHEKWEHFWFWEYNAAIWKKGGMEARWPAGLCGPKTQETGQNFKGTGIWGNKHIIFLAKA